MFRLGGLQRYIQRNHSPYKYSSYVNRLQNISNFSTMSENSQPFNKILAANRGEISTRILRAANELGTKTVAIFSHEDRLTQHRYKADQAFLVGEGKTPVGAYLDIEGIIDIAVNNQVDAIHPGYGFLSENVEFARSCAYAGIEFIGPTVENLEVFGDKTSARNLAITTGVPVVPGTEHAVKTLAEAEEWIEKENVQFPIIIKASMGGGGRGMRVVNSIDELPESFSRATSEALGSFGDSSVFIEKYLYQPRHIEVQILGDGTGKVVHLYDRDCSVQRRHQKVIESAPALYLPEKTREAILADAVKITSAAKYKNAGTVEFLVDADGNHYFIEVNPRIQVEHTVTEEVTGIDLVQSQILIASGKTFDELNLKQENIKTNGFAMQCRITTENPTNDFMPDTGVIEAWRTPGGMGIRLDDGPGFSGAHITPHYDSLLMKLTTKGATRQDAIIKMQRALKEFRVRGVSTNKYFLLNVLQNKEFLDGFVTTSFIGNNQDLLLPAVTSNRGHKMLMYLADIIVNGPEESLGAIGGKCSEIKPIVPKLTQKDPKKNKKSLRQIYLEKGGKGFAKAVRANKGLLLTDTTWRDAHQSLLATRIRTHDLKTIAEPTSIALANAFSLECWGGATFDVAMRFLKECPWDRLEQLRELVPDIPFQMLLRGANAVGYTSYPDNVVYEFCKQAVKSGMDVFRIFDSLNYLENMKLGIDAVGTAGGIVEASICYTGDVADPSKKHYTLDYYLDFARKLVDLDIHILNIKDMAGLLKPEAAKILISALRKEFPNTPIHVHTHDTAGTGVASMLACAQYGADAVDCAMDSMSGTTSQPSLGAIANALKGSKLDTGLDLNQINQINEYWEEARGIYNPFESGQKSGSSDVYDHEMPGGQYTNLLFQSQQLGLSGRWPAIKRAYAAANDVLGDIIKVTPSSKVVGDLAQFMVQNNLSEQDVYDQAESLSFPQSVIEYFQGYLGIPPFGFPEPLRSKVLKGRKLPNGKECFDGRPGAEMDPYDFEGEKKKLMDKWGSSMRDQDVLSHAMYPTVFNDFMNSKKKYDNLSVLDTKMFLEGMKVGEEASIQLEHGKILFIKLHAIGDIMEDGLREVIFELNGQQRVVRVADKKSNVDIIRREKADENNDLSIGAPMPGVVLELKHKVGDKVKKGDPIVVLSAMKMETVVAAPVSGTIKKLPVNQGESLEGGDLIFEIEE